MTDIGQQQSQLKWPDHVDLLVVGSGAAGLTAALVAAQEGLNVVLCEKSNFIGGTTAFSSGGCWIPGNSHSYRAGIPDRIEDARAYLNAEIGDQGRDDRREAFLSSSAKAIDYLEEHSEVKFRLANPYPDYHPDKEGAAKGGRMLLALMFDGRELGKDFNLIRSPRPGFMVFGGMMVSRDEARRLTKPWESLASFRFSLGVLLRFVKDRLRYRRGTRLLLGNALVARFLISLKQKNVPILLNAELVEIVRPGKDVEGAILKINNTRHMIKTRLGIVLAGGGFAANSEFRERLMPEHGIDRAITCDDAQGGTIKAAQAIGASLDTEHKLPAYFMPVSIMSPRGKKEFAFPHVIMDRARPGLIAINRSGKRFVNEAASYHDFVAAMLRESDGVPNNPAYLICDRIFVRRYGIGLVRPVWQWLPSLIRSGYLISDGTISGLARKIHVDPETLEATIAAHNEDAKVGTDQMFGKGSNELNRFNGDPDNKPNPCLAPIVTSPFFAIEVHPAAIATSVGLKTDGDARVLDRHDQAIAGLYACGSDQSSIMRGNYVGPGIMLGPAITFAYRAAMHMAKGEKASAAKTP